MPRRRNIKNDVTQVMAACLSLLVLWPGTAAAADAVIRWNENAAKAATAACLHISGNGLAESRMYAMVHAAVHDAVNTIDRRSRPYAFDAEATGPASLNAAVAAAARDVLVTVIATLPESPECVANGIANATRCMPRRSRHPEWTCKDERHRGGPGRRRRHYRAARR